MKKAIMFLLAASLLVCMCAMPVAAGNKPIEGERGTVHLHAEVPEGYNDVVYVVFKDFVGRWATFELQYSDGYRAVLNMEQGTYSVSGALPSVHEADYSVSVSSEKITVGNEALEVNIVVSAKASGTQPGGIVTEPTVAVTEPQPSVPEATVAPETTAPEEPSDNVTKPTSPSESTEGTKPENGSNPTDATEPTGEAKDIWDIIDFSWKDTLVSLLGTAGFVGIVFLCAYLYRKYGTSF